MLFSEKLAEYVFNIMWAFVLINFALEAIGTSNGWHSLSVFERAATIFIYQLLAKHN